LLGEFLDLVSSARQADKDGDGSLDVAEYKAAMIAALRERANRPFQLPGFVPQAPGFRRPPVQIKDLKQAI